MSSSARPTDRVSAPTLPATADALSTLAEAVRMGQELRDRERNRGRNGGAAAATNSSEADEGVGTAASDNGKEVRDIDEEQAAVNEHKA